MHKDQFVSSLVWRLRQVVAWLYRRSPPVRQAAWRFNRLTRPAWLGTLRRTTPLSDKWGYDRGTPVDRYYIERFLAAHRQDIRGSVLEVQDSGYTDRYGTGVTHRAVLDIDPANPRATIVADLAAAEALVAEQFDCFVLIQTLQYIYDLPAAVAHAHRLLKPGGVLLATVPVISRTEPELVQADYWRFKPPACAALFGEIFGAGRIVVRSYGNVLSCIAALAGMAHQELAARELDVHDERAPLIVAIRAVKR